MGRHKMVIYKGERAAVTRSGGKHFNMLACPDGLHPEGTGSRQRARDDEYHRWSFAKHFLFS